VQFRKAGQAVGHLLEAHKETARPWLLCLGRRLAPGENSFPDRSDSESRGARKWAVLAVRMGLPGEKSIHVPLRARNAS